ncbi:oxidoreductase [Pseudonocardia sp. EC080610-09]|nr:oxidoreductase [Pseudonocardia sp. EC080610-09]ALL84009.1 oxidoreductase [Pseudonocardia sp. EC080619-01]
MVTGVGRRIGVIGLGPQGRYLARWADRLGFEVVIGCETRDVDDPGSIPRTRDWAELLGAGLDGVVLADDFDTHAPRAVAFLDAGVHVLSETAACASEAEGRDLVAAADASPASYSFAENYVALPHVRSIAQVVAAGEVGDIELIEAEYLHGLGPAALQDLLGAPGHWRNRISPTAYCTHTLSPVLAITGARPVSVAAHGIGPPGRETAVVLVVRLSTGALAVARHGFLQGEPDSHWSWVSVRGTRGLVESRRMPGADAWSIRLRSEPWASPTGAVREQVRVPERVSGGDRDEPGSAGTVGVLEAFRACLDDGAPPLVPVRAAVDASLVGVVAAGSLAAGGTPVAVPRI